MIIFLFIVSNILHTNNSFFAGYMCKRLSGVIVAWRFVRNAHPCRGTSQPRFLDTLGTRP